MTPERWQQVKHVFQAALELEPESRTPFVLEQCGVDNELRNEVESLLAAERTAGDFIAEPAVASAVLREFQDDADPMIGRRLGPYRVQKAIGHGGMGTVYLAVRADDEYEKSVAIKMISRGMDTNLVIRRFRNERQILAHLEHPNIARLFDGGSSDEGLPYFVMEYVEGVPIHTYSDACRLTTSERLKLFLEVCAAVEYAHRKRIVHRDIKPGNILVDSDGTLKLLDFGIAKIINPEFGEARGGTITIAGRMMTPDYASPEQVRGRPATTSSDIYSLGVLLYELLTGRLPYRIDSQSPEEIARIVCGQEPEKPSVVVGKTQPVIARDGSTVNMTPEMISSTRDGHPDRLRRRLTRAIDAIVLKALQKEPSQRYSSVSELAADIQKDLADLPVAAKSGAFWQNFARALPTLRSAGAIMLGLLQGRRNGAAAHSPPPQNQASESPVPDSLSVHEPQPAQRARRSVAVLGFRSLSGNPDVAWLATALPEMFTTELAVGEQIRAIPRERITRLAAQSSLDDLDLSTRESCARIALQLGAHLLVHGSYAELVHDSVREIRLDVRLYDASSGDSLVALAERGPESDLFELVSRTGTLLRQKLGVWAESTSEVRNVRAAFPAGTDAVRLYSEGLAKLRIFDALAAKSLLEEAARLDPMHSLTHSALSVSWATLGYDANALEEARKAYELSGNLSREEQLSIEGRYREALREWDKAIDIYLRLWGYFSDDIEYGLRLASMQVVAGKTADALATVEALRRLPPPICDDPRIDFAEAEALGAQSDFKREQLAYARTVEKARQQDSRLLLARALLRLGRAYHNLGNRQESLLSLQECRDIFASAGDRAGVAMALNSLASVLSDNNAGTIAMYEESLEICRQIGDKKNSSSALNNLGVYLKDQGRYSEALQAHEEALALRREVGDKAWQAISLNNIGVVLFEQDRLDDASIQYKESLELCREIGDRRNIVRALHNLSIVLREQGRLREARQLQEECIATRRIIGDKRGTSISALELGSILHLCGDVESAKRVLTEALPVARETEMKTAEAQILHLLGDVAGSQDDLVTARTCYESALQLRIEISERRTVLETRVALAALCLEEGRPEIAERMAREVIEEINEEIGIPIEVMARIQLAQACLAQDRTDEASEAVARARVVASDSGRDSIRTGILLTSARVEAAAGRTADAIEILSKVIEDAVRTECRSVELDARLAKAEIDRIGIEEFRNEALQQGFKLIARKAAALSSGTSACA